MRLLLITFEWTKSILKSRMSRLTFGFLWSEGMEAFLSSTFLTMPYTKVRSRHSFLALVESWGRGNLIIILLTFTRYVKFVYTRCFKDLEESTISFHTFSVENWALMCVKQAVLMRKKKHAIWNVLFSPIVRYKVKWFTVMTYQYSKIPSTISYSLQSLKHALWEGHKSLNAQSKYRIIILTLKNISFQSSGLKWSIITEEFCGGIISIFKW